MGIDEMTDKINEKNDDDGEFAPPSCHGRSSL